MAFVARKALVSGHGNTRTAAWQHSSLAHHAEPANSSDHRACRRMAGRLVTDDIRSLISAIVFISVLTILLFRLDSPNA